MDLTLETLDDISRALFAGDNYLGGSLPATQLIPYLEWNWLRERHSLPVLKPQSAGLIAIESAMNAKYALGYHDQARSGFIRVRRTSEDDTHPAWVQFLDRFRHHARAAGLTDTFSAQLTGVVK